MKAKELMTREVSTCRSDAPLSEAARIMWEQDCGFVPVTDPETGRISGVITDRDTCMAAYTQGKSLPEIPVARAMSPKVVSCGADDDVQSVQELMRKHQVRRIPVIDLAEKPIGVIALNDLACKAGGQSSPTMKREVADTLYEICRHRIAEAG